MTSYRQIDFVALDVWRLNLSLSGWVLKNTQWY
jgi:hypothetical protein